MKYKVIQDQNGWNHLVPSLTPDDFFQRAAEKWEITQKNLQRCAVYIAHINLQSKESCFELEDDEFMTAREKAIDLSKYRE